MSDFGEKNLDVLQNIEFGIIEVYRADPSLLDETPRTPLTPWCATIMRRKSSALRLRPDSGTARSGCSSMSRGCASGDWAGLGFPARRRRPHRESRSPISASACARFRSQFHAGPGKAAAKDTSISSASTCRERVNLRQSPLQQERAQLPSPQPRATQRPLTGATDPPGKRRI